MNLDHDFVQVSKLSEDQKKEKKKVFAKNGTLFFFKFKWTPTLRCTPESNYWGLDADVDHTQTIGGNTVKLLGDMFPLGFRTPERKHGSAVR